MIKHKALSSIFAIIVFISFVFFSACTNSNNEHTHHYSNEWTYDNNYHWHKATCEHTTLISAKSAHSFGSDDKCDVCQYIKTHKHSLLLVKAKVATCTQSGNILYYTCSGCGKFFSDNTGTTTISEGEVTIKATGHNYGEWENTQEATCTTGGIKKRICSVCKDQEIENISATGHQYKNGICTKCGEKQPTSGLYYGYYLGNKSQIYIWKFEENETTDTDIVIPNYYGSLPVVAISSEVFKWNKEITSVTIPSNIIQIGSRCFWGCSNLVSVSLSEGLERIEYEAFRACSLSSITIPSSVTTIGSMAFDHCESLVSVDIKNGVSTIGEQAFFYCHNLKFITIPNSITTIEADTFYWCDNLSSIYFNGTEEEWNNIVIKRGNEALYNADIYFYSNEKPVKEGNFWHYSNEKPTVWKKDEIMN